MAAPLYLRLADTLETMIRRRSLRSGDRVPSVRRFSLEQRVSVPTALNAYAVLEARGLIEARPKSGFFVKPAELDRIPPPSAAPVTTRVCHLDQADPLDILSADHYHPDLVPFGSLVPCPDLLPSRALGRILAAEARKLGPGGSNYDMGPGHFGLRREIARRLLSAGCALGPDDLVVTVGATEAVSLALRATCRPGDTVAVESPTFFGILRQLRELGLNALPIPVDPGEGMDLDALAVALRRTKVAACVVVPNFNNPVGFLMPDGRRRELLRLAVSHGFAVIEDDIYGDLPHRGPRPHCLRALNGECVLLCSSFSKSVAPGYRIGFIVPGPWKERVRVLKAASTSCGVTLAAAAMAEFLRSGSYDRFLRSYREALRQQTERMREAIGQAFPGGVRVSRPQGGFVLWCELPGRVDALALFRKARESGVTVAPGPIFSPKAGKCLNDGRASGQNFSNYIRLNCGYPWTPKVERAIGILGHLVRELAR